MPILDTSYRERVAARMMTLAQLERVRNGLLMVCVLSVTQSTEVLADDGPISAIDNMLSASPTITSVAVGSVVLTDLSFLLIATRDAIRGRSSEAGLFGVQVGVAGIQSLGFLTAPFAFDVSRWKLGEQLLLLLPAQVTATTLLNHGIWSLVENPIDPASRFGVSFLIGGNTAFTAIGLGGLLQEKWAPLGLGIAEVAHTGLAAGISIERMVNDPEHKSEWASLFAWSLLGLSHGVGSVLVGAPGSRVSANESSSAATATISPFAVPTAGGVVIGGLGSLP